MEPVLVLAHTEADGTLAKPALEALAAALALGGEVTLGLVGAEVRAAADQTAGCGAVRFLAVAGEAFAQPRYATDAAAAEALCRAAGAGLVIAPATSRWARALPGAAYRLGGRVDTHATGIARGQRGPGSHSLVLPAAHGGGADALGAALGGAARPWLRYAVERSGRLDGGGAGSGGSAGYADGRHGHPRSTGR